MSEDDDDPRRTALVIPISNRPGRWVNMNVPSPMEFHEFETMISILQAMRPGLVEEE